MLEASGNRNCKINVQNFDALEIRAVTCDTRSLNHKNYHMIKWLWFVSMVFNLFVITAQASVKLDAAYSESANTFAMLDGVSNWWPEYFEPGYQDYWKNRSVNE